mmetsp:Transcript_7175/g.17486  ORF Transcript_7175/g.17486 Transcript_7175/m.17486 type:complete len:469 (-) Transcript_7175:15-1421(-)
MATCSIFIRGVGGRHGLVVLLLLIAVSPMPFQQLQSAFAYASSDTDSESHTGGGVGVVPLGLTPQMGWNPWNLFGCDGIHETLVREIATAMVSTGLSDLGYKFINLDDCWQAKKRSSDQTIVADASRFPSGIADLSDFIHGLGLKLGLYSDSGLFTCQRRPGSHGHESRDAEIYVSWEIDYLKYDNCYATGLGGGVRKRYETMRDALQNATASSDRKIFYSLCEWGIGDPATWAGNVGNSWRTTGDIQPTWKSILRNLDDNDRWYSYASPEWGWNDPDMLQIDTIGGLTVAEQRAHFTLWSLVKAPLLLANDIRAIPEEIMAIISNPEIIALNQDPLGIQGYKRSSRNSTLGTDGPMEVWAGDLEDGDVAVVLFNRSTKTESITVRFHDVVAIGGSNDGSHRNDDTMSAVGASNKLQPLREKISAHVRDLWARSDLGLFRDEFEGIVPSHDVLALRLSKVSIYRTETN